MLSSDNSCYQTRWYDWGLIVFVMYLCFYVVNFNLYHHLWTVQERDYIWHAYFSSKYHPFKWDQGQWPCDQHICVYVNNRFSSAVAAGDSDTSCLWYILTEYLEIDTYAKHTHSWCLCSFVYRRHRFIYSYQLMLDSAPNSKLLESFWCVFSSKLKFITTLPRKMWEPYSQCPHFTVMQ